MPKMSFENHIMTQFDEELEEIRTQLMEMGGKVEQQLKNSIQAVIKADSSLAEMVIKEERLVDEMEVDSVDKVVLAGETRGPKIEKENLISKVRECIKDIGYDQEGFSWKTANIETHLHEQSTDIAMGVDSKDNKDEGAGDQGIMFGYATDETENFMPLALEISHLLLKKLADIRHEGKVMTYLRPDSKSQVTINYSDQHQPNAIETIVISTQHDDFDSELEMQKKIASDIQEFLIPKVIQELSRSTQDLFKGNIHYLINPTGKFVIGGPHGDTGLTGRKIIVDTYGGKGAHGGAMAARRGP